MAGTWRRALKTVDEVKQWGDDTKAYADEQRVKRGEKPRSTNKNEPKPKDNR